MPKLGRWVRDAGLLSPHNVNLVFVKKARDAKLALAGAGVFQAGASTWLCLTCCSHQGPLPTAAAKHDALCQSQRGLCHRPDPGTSRRPACSYPHAPGATPQARPAKREHLMDQTPKTHVLKEKDARKGKEFRPSPIKEGSCFRLTSSHLHKGSIERANRLLVTTKSAEQSHLFIHRTRSAQGVGAMQTSLGRASALTPQDLSGSFARARCAAAVKQGPN